MAPDSETRTSRLKSGFLNTLIFKISPGASRYSCCALAVAAPSPIVQTKKNAARPTQRRRRSGRRIFRLTAACALALIVFYFLLMLDPTKKYFKSTAAYCLARRRQLIFFKQLDHFARRRAHFHLQPAQTWCSKRRHARNSPRRNSSPVDPAGTWLRG